MADTYEDDDMAHDFGKADSRPGRGAGYDRPSTSKNPTDFSKIERLTDEEVRLWEVPAVARIAQDLLSLAPPGMRDQVAQWIVIDRKRQDILAEIRKAQR